MVYKLYTFASLQSGFDSFSPQWYLDVGSILVSAVISHIIFPPIIPAIHWYVVQPLRRKFSEDTAVTQVGFELCHPLKKFMNEFTSRSLHFSG